jgi:hypothetical protein
MNPIDRQRILGAGKVGYEFEFFCEKKPKEVARILSALLKKKIIVPVVLTGLDEFDKIHHSEDEVTATVFKIEPDYSGGKAMMELVTGPVPYAEGRIILIQVLKWIRENGWTTDKCGLHVNLSFDDKKIKLRMPMEKIDTLKFILNFDEEEVYKHFPDRRNNTYTRTIKTVYPINKFTFADQVGYISKERYVMPSTKYFGVNFLKAAKGYLEFRYMGGAGYEKKTTGILEFCDYCLLFMNSILQNPDYTQGDLIKLNRMLGDYKKVIESFSSPEQFFMNYRKIRLLVDLKGEEQILKTYWVRLRDKLFELIVENGFKSGILNLDTDLATFQLRKAKLSKATGIHNIQLFECEISGNISDCDLYSCVIKDSQLSDCRIYSNNEIIRSKIAMSPIYIGNELKDCYVDNKINIINGVMDGGVLRSGEIGMLAIIHDNVDIVSPAKPADTNKAITNMQFHQDTQTNALGQWSSK